jgi:hypothetical protein
VLTYTHYHSPGLSISNVPHLDIHLHHHVTSVRIHGLIDRSTQPSILFLHEVYLSVAVRTRSCYPHLSVHALPLASTKPTPTSPRLSSPERETKSKNHLHPLMPHTPTPLFSLASTPTNAHATPEHAAASSSQLRGFWSNYVVSFLLHAFIVTWAKHLACSKQGLEAQCLASFFLGNCPK